MPIDDSKERCSKCGMIGKVITTDYNKHLLCENPDCEIIVQPLGLYT